MLRAASLSLGTWNSPRSAIALDSKTGIRLIDALLSINAQLGTTTLIITHNAMIQDVAHRVMFFADGQIAKVQVNETRRAAESLTW